MRRRVINPATCDVTTPAELTAILAHLGITVTVELLGSSRRNNVPFTIWSATFAHPSARIFSRPISLAYASSCSVAFVVRTLMRDALDIADTDTLAEWAALHGYDQWQTEVQDLYYHHQVATRQWNEFLQTVCAFTGVDRNAVWDLFEKVYF